jgi:hypothetical protein
VCISFFLSPGSFLPFYPKENNSIDRALFGLYGLFGLFALVSNIREIWYGIRESYHRLMVIAGAV